jgi:tRNA 2-selenouridine synthase
MTGVGKTTFILRLQREGFSVVDLEGLACHRGSAFGELGLSQTLSQKRFETLLWDALARFDPRRPVYVESESRKVGDLRVPEALIERMRAAPCIALELALERRVALLLDDYDFYLRLALEWAIVFLEGPPVAAYRRHAGQMTTQELTMGQIQTAEKHLSLLAARDDIPDAKRARRNFLLMLARSWAVLGDQSRSRASLLEAMRLDPALLTRPWVLRRLAASVLK